MSGVKRYIPEGYTQPASRSGTGTHMVESRDGDYVLASDYDALAQRCRELDIEASRLSGWLGACDRERLAAQQERDALRAEVERFREGLGIAQRHRDELQAEVEALRKDAERYRWLRDCGDETFTAFAKRTAYSAEQCDSAIDAAMRNEQ